MGEEKHTSKQQAVIDKDELLEAIETRLGTKSAEIRLNRMEEFLYYGNGDSLKTWMGVQETKLDVVVEAVRVIPELKLAVDKHHATPHMWDYMKNPTKVIAVLVGGFVVLHTLATYLPNFWNGVMVALGLPHLVVPLQ